MKRIKRLFWHLLYPGWWVKRYFPPEEMVNIEAAIRDSEKLHHGEIRFAVESSLPVRALWNNEAMHERSVEIFSLLKVWDTEQNNGVLIYVLLADHQVEIVADRGLNNRVDAAKWQAICNEMKLSFGRNRHAEGVMNGIERISQLLQQHYAVNLPSAEAQSDVCENPNELSDRPVIL